MGTHGVAGHVHLFSQLPLCSVCHERRVGGIVEREHPTLLALLLGSQCCRFAGRLGQSVQQGLVGDVQRVGLVFLQQVLRELQREHRGLLRQLAQPFLASLVEQCTGAYESLVAVVQQLFLLGSQSAVVQMHVAYPLKQPWVQPYVVGVLRQDGLHLLSQCVHLVVRLCRQQVEEHRAHAAQQVVVALVLLGIDDGVVERRLLRVVDGLLYLLIVAADALHEGLLVVFQADTVERHRVVRCVIRFQKRILVLTHTNVLFLTCKGTKQFQYGQRIRPLLASFIL